MKDTGFKNIDEYINTFDGHVRDRLETMRKVIAQEAPEAVEAIAYQMPTFKLNGKNLVHFAGYNSHIGFYPTPSGTEADIPGIEKYKTGKGTLQFPLDEPLPLDLIKKVMKLRTEAIKG